MRVSFFQRCLAAAVLAAGLTTQVFAQDAYPNKPIRIIVPFPLGGGLDMMSRLIGNRVTERWKVPVLIETRPGANTIIAAEHVAKSPPDGYTVLVAIDSTLAMNPFLYSKLPYDPVKDFTPITLATIQPIVLAVNPSLGVNSVAELIALAKAKPGQLSYGYGVAFNQLVGEMFTSMANVQMLGVPYKGAAPAMTDLMGGTVSVIFPALASAMGNIKNGNIRALAVSSAKRNSAIPQVPTLAESGLTGYDMPSWVAYVAPAGLPKDIAAWLHREFAGTLQLPEIRSRLAEVGQEVVAGTPEELAQYLKSELLKFERLVKASGIKAQ